MRVFDKKASLILDSNSSSGTISKNTVLGESLEAALLSITLTSPYTSASHVGMKNPDNIYTFLF